MKEDNNIWNLAEGYVSGSMSETELNALKDRLSADQAFAAEFHETVNLLRSLQGSGGQKRFKAMLKDVSATHAEIIVPGKQPRTISLRAHYLRTGAIAAGIAVLTSLTTFWAAEHSNKKIASQYSLLKRDLETYKRSQSQLISDVNNMKAEPAPAQARYTGTGFAISNDGYLVTNYHVTEGADSIYIQSNTGRYYKAYLVTFDKKNDVAILKVNDKGFRFGKGDLPYTFAPAKRQLGATVYSLGFPQDEIVYNKGYISSKNGFEGDSMQYRLEMPSAPGQSGAPVLDAKGNIIGLITGKESESEGTTYAVSSKAVLQLVKNLPKAQNIKFSKTNRMGNMDREEQIEKMQLYTYSVKVYKK